MLGTEERTRAAEAPTDRRWAWWAIGGVAASLVVVSVWGVVLEQRGADLHLGAVPFYGAAAWRATWAIVIPVVLAALIVTVGPGLAQRLGWVRLGLTTWAATAAWSVALGASAGWSALSAPLTSRFDYLPALPAARALGIGEFVRTYVERLADYPVHVQGHPPGMVALLWALDAVGLRGAGWAAAVLILLASTMPVAVLVTTRHVVGEGPARHVTPFLVLAPWTLFVATIGDGLFAAMAAWTIALLALAAATKGTSAGIRAWSAAAASGALGALTLHFTYGLVPLLVLVGGTVLVALRRVMLVVPAALGAVAVTGAWMAGGFWWFDGFTATRYWHDVGASVDRPYAYFLVANLVVLAVMLGPAVVAGLTVPLGRAALLVVPALVAVAVADLSGLSKAEVERIWVPFMPWITLAVIGVVRRWPREVGRWLSAQAGLTIALQAFIAWPW